MLLPSYSHLQQCRLVNFTEIFLIVNLTDRLGTTVDLNENVHESYDYRIKYILLVYRCCESL